MPIIATAPRRGWIAALVAGGAIALTLAAFAAKAQKRAPATIEPDWAAHSAFAEQSAAAYFD